MTDSILSECLLITKTHPQNLEGSGTVVEGIVITTLDSWIIRKISQLYEEVKITRTKIESTIHRSIISKSIQ
jgi:hypothetical protein